MSETQQRKQALRAARALVLAARNNGGRGLDGIWEYLRDELDATPRGWSEIEAGLEVGR